jgi:parvulin-like peptidyl-prolyl isomerase/SH3-like domain-containing protein
MRPPGRSLAETLMTRILSRPALRILAAVGMLAAALVPAARAAHVALETSAVMRSRPEALAPVVAVLAPSALVFVQESEGAWHRVSTGDGQVGWVPGALGASTLTPDASMGIGARLPPTLRVAFGGAVRSRPATGAPEVFALTPRSVVSVVTRLGDWAQVKVQEHEGWLDLVSVPVEAASAEEAPGQPAASAAAAPPVASDAAAEARARREAARVQREREEVQRQAEREAAKEQAAADRAATAQAAAEKAAAEKAATAKAAAETTAGERAATEQAAAEKAATAKAAGEKAAAEKAAAETAAKEQAAKDKEARKQARAARKAEAAQASKAPAPEAQASKTPAPEAQASKAPAPEAQASKAPAPEAKPESVDEIAAAKAERDAARAAREEADKAAKVERARLAAERKAQQEAERQARAAEKSAAAEKGAKGEAAKEAAPAPPAPAPKPVPTPESAGKSQQQEAQRAEREAQHAQEAAQKEAARQEHERAAAERQAAKDADKQAHESERQAREAKAQQAEADAAARGPVAPVEIPPAISVSMGAKAPAERPSDPESNPLVRQGAPTASSLAPPRPAATGSDNTYAPFDAQQQLDRSVASLHSNETSALGLSTGESRPETTPSTYIGADAKPVSTSVVSQIVARVNDEILTNDEFDRRVDETLKDMRRNGTEDMAPSDELTVKRRLLAKAIEQLLLIDHARVMGLAFDKVYATQKERFMKQAGIKDDQELLQLLDATGRTWDDFRRELLREAVPAAILKHEVFDHITVDEDEIERHYRLHQEDYAEEACVRLREIVLQPRPEERTREFNLRLDRVLQRLEAGEDFCAVAHDQSEAPSADDCGLLPQCFTRSQLDDKVALVAFRLSVGDVEPIQTDWGYHVLRLEEARPRRLRPLVEVRDQIVDALRGEQANDEVRRYIDRLREAARIEVAPEYQQLLEAPARSSREAVGGEGQ